jgi:response regulator RpfG family c-di-GMP phosphodiesterase
MEDRRFKILYVDDEVNNLVAFKANFRKYYEIFTAESAAEGRVILNEQYIDIIITDQRMPNETGVEFLQSIINEYPHPIRMLLTGYADIEAVIAAINKGEIFRYITKPWNEHELKMTIDNACHVYSLREENRELTKSLLQANKQLEFLLRQKLLS